MSFVNSWIPNNFQTEEGRLDIFEATWEYSPKWKGCYLQINTEELTLVDVENKEKTRKFPTNRIFTFGITGKNTLEISFEDGRGTVVFKAPEAEEIYDVIAECFTEATMH